MSRGEGGVGGSGTRPGHEVSLQADFLTLPHTHTISAWLFLLSPEVPTSPSVLSLSLAGVGLRATVLFCSWLSSLKYWHLSEKWKTWEQGFVLFVCGTLEAWIEIPSDMF